MEERVAGRISDGKFPVEFGNQLLIRLTAVTNLEE